MATVYLVRCLKNDKCYIGCSNSGPSLVWKELCASLNRGSYPNTHLQKDWNLFKKENFAFEVLEIRANTKKSTRKNQYVYEFMSTDPTRGYNVGRQPKKSI